MSVSLCDAAMAGNVEEVLQLFKNFYYFKLLDLLLYILMTS